ncbi:MAG TPA: dihydroxyacetone kinase phosphoryl donor subunit DhaM [Jiangellaceae bacterium]|nr:dihydroxyacetone kinase phosphoryl donor subunit DhaM [Jiangellaceae bacterium]
MTVGVVLVSHSADLAEAAAALARELAGPSTAVLPAGGTEDGRFGTSIEKLSAAVAAAESGDGVAVLMDVGSAVLTSKALLADLDEDDPDIRLVDAPLVEGAIAAAVIASTGQDLAAVVAAAEQARGMHKL